MKEAGNPTGFQQQQRADEQEEKELDTPEEQVHFRQCGQDITTQEHQQDNIDRKDDLAPEIDPAGIGLIDVTDGM